MGITTRVKNNSIKTNFENKEYIKVDFLDKTEKRFNELIYNEIDKILSIDEKAIVIGEDIENNNLEGNHSETENYYEVLVYFRKPGERFDSFIGYQKIQFPL